MCLRSEYHIFAGVPLVPCRCPAAGHWPVRRPAPSGGQKEMRSLRRLLSAEIQSGEILPGLCRYRPPEEGGRAPTQTLLRFYAFRGKKALVNQGLPRTRTTTKPPLRAFKKRYLINHGDTFFRKCPHSIE